MRYWLDTEFIEDGRTIDLLSIGIVAEDGREFYAQYEHTNTGLASDWVARNVLPHLQHFDMGLRRRSCPSYYGESVDRGRGVSPAQCARECPWLSRADLAERIRMFCSPEQHDKPEFWGYYADYDWVVLCQIFGTMMDLPQGWPMYCRDIKQWCDDLGNPKLPEQGKGEHHALADARWNRLAWEFLAGLSPKEIVNAIR